MEFKFFVS